MHRGFKETKKTSSMLQGVWDMYTSLLIHMYVSFDTYVCLFGMYRGFKETKKTSSMFICTYIDGYTHIHAHTHTHTPIPIYMPIYMQCIKTKEGPIPIYIHCMYMGSKRGLYPYTYIACIWACIWVQDPLWTYIGLECINAYLEVSLVSVNPFFEYIEISLNI